MNAEKSRKAWIVVIKESIVPILIGAITFTCFRLIYNRYQHLGKPYLDKIFFALLILGAQSIPDILPRVLATVVLVYVILGFMCMFMPIRIVLDKPTQTVTVRKLSPFFLVSRKRVIPFSDVKSVVIVYAPEESGGGEHSTGSSRDAWKVSLNIDGKKKLNLVYWSSHSGLRFWIIQNC